ncbi:MAG: hypothetical protein ABIT76_11835 [Chthoniobacterales bacterium]
MPDDLSASSPAPEEPASSGVNIHLSASLRADFEALQNDFEQANAMSQDLQCQLAGKSNEFALLKHVFEKTQKSLTQLQKDIEELREERHRLANEAMRATALDLLLQKAAADRDALQQELEKMKSEHAGEIAKLASELTAAQEQPPSPLVSVRGARISHPQAAHILSSIEKSVDQLRGLIAPSDTTAPASQPRPHPTPKPAIEPDFINISFSS